MTRIHDDMEQYGSIEDAEKHNEEVNRRMEQDEREKKGSFRSPSYSSGRKATKSERKVINKIYLDSLTHGMVSKLATMRGISMESLCTSILRDFFSDPKLADNPGFKIDIINQRLRRRIEYEETVHVSAAQYSLSQSAELSDDIVKLCDELGIDPEKVRASAVDEPMNEAIASLKSDPGYKRNRCIKWMVTLMKKHNYRIKATDANTLARKEEFDKDTIRYAKSQCGVVTNPSEDGHVWVLTPEKRGMRSILKGETQ